MIASIQTLFRIMGPSPAAYVRAFDPRGEHPELRAMLRNELSWLRNEALALGQLVEDRYPTAGTDSATGVLPASIR